jgi:uncharacterized protein (TIGR00661 family)
MKKILWGISGIGNGHFNRQAPIIAHYARTSRIVLFVYGESLRNARRVFGRDRNISIVEIDVPFWAGKEGGLDFLKTARLNAGKDFLSVTCRAYARAEKLIGKPDLVVTDYEPVSVGYGYACGAPVVTFDQQSKYLCGDFPKRLGGQAYADETTRLRFFFPQAAERIACSFFRVHRKPGAPEVTIVPPPLKQAIVSLTRKPRQGERSVLVYISSQRKLVQPLEEVIRICGSQPGVKFHLFAKEVTRLHAPPPNVAVYRHGDQRFYGILAECNGIVSTAGHMLLSEAMYLGIPVYAIPLAVYEQQMNAHVIARHGFGISFPRFEWRQLGAFIRGLDRFAAAIKKDRSVLLRGPGQGEIVRRLNRILHP